MTEEPETLAAFTEPETAAAFFDAVPDRAFEWVEIPEWQMRLRVRGMTGGERDAWEGALADAQKPGSLGKNWWRYQRATMVSRCVIDSQGARLFSRDDVMRLDELDARGLDRIYDAARKASGITQEDVEQMAGNSSSGPNAENGSGSLSPSEVAP
jgi:hypothetical protein